MAEIQGNSYENAQEQFKKNGIDTPELDQRIADIRAGANKAKEQTQREQYDRKMDQVAAEKMFSGINAPADYLDFRFTDNPGNKDKIILNASNHFIDENNENEKTGNITNSQNINLTTKDEQIIQSTINRKPGNPEEIKNMFNKIADMFPPTIKNFLEKFANLFGINKNINNSGTTENFTMSENGTETPEAKEKKESTLRNLEGTEFQFGDKKGKLDISKITLEKNPNGGENYILKSQQTGFDYVKTPIEVTPDGKFIVPDGKIQLSNVPFLAKMAGITDGNYSLVQNGKQIQINRIA